MNFLAEKDQVEMVLPNEWGKEEVFELRKAAVLSPSLQAAFPEIKTYVGRSLERPDIHIRLSYTPTGINAWIRYPNGVSRFLQPLNGQQNRYLSYTRSAESAIDGFNCSTPLKDNWKDQNLPTVDQKKF